MASGDMLAVVTALANEPPSSNYATLVQRNGHWLLAFDAGTDESAVFTLVMPDHYGGNGIDVSLRWAAATATSGNCIWDVAIERINDDVQDIDSDSFAAANSVTAAAASASGELSYDSVTFSDGADMDSVAAGDVYRIKITRDADNASDTMAGDAQLKAVYVTEQ